MKHDMFYAIVPAPATRPWQVKFGYSSNVGSRLRSYYTANPNALVLGAWPLRRHYERPVMEHLAKVANGRLVQGEVYEFPELLPLVMGLYVFFETCDPMNPFEGRPFPPRRRASATWNRLQNEVKAGVDDE